MLREREQLEKELLALNALPQERLKDLVARGVLVSVTTFADHMRPDVHWIEPEEFGQAFDELTKEERIMTTSITVNAHGGWPVLVTTKQGEAGQEKSIHTTTVEPNTERTFYIHSGLQIVGVEEQPRPKQIEPEPLPDRDADCEDERE